PRQLYGGRLPAQVAAVLRETGLPPQALELEITENTLLRLGSEYVAELEALRALGVGLALDDYGTGYASLSLLKKLPVSRLKIDRSFVSTMLEHEGDAAVVQVVLFLGE